MFVGVVICTGSSSWHVWQLLILL